MQNKRAIGRWALTGLMINSIIGSGIFGVPDELNRLVGAASPWVFVLAGLAIAAVVMCFAEVGSQFSEDGGPYLYVRTAFGRFAGLQIAWFAALTPIAAAAAQANLFVNYLAGLDGALGAGLPRAAIIVGLIGIPVTANAFGSRAGKSLSSVLVLAKLSPLVLLIGIGLAHFHAHAAPAPVALAPGANAWFSALLLAVFSFGGFEDIPAATGDVIEPRRDVAFALGASLLVCVAVYSLVQLVTVTALAGAPSERPLAAAAAVWLGPGGSTFVAVAAMISTAGAISATVLAVPRILSALGEGGDAPKILARVQGGGAAPVVATMVVAAIILVLAVTGTFTWALAVTAGSAVITFGSVCASLLRLRVLRPTASAVRIPFGNGFAVIGIGLSMVMLMQLQAREAALLGVTAAVGLANWLFVRQRGLPVSA